MPVTFLLLCWVQAVRVEIVKNFLSLKDCSLLNQWALLGVEKGWLSTGITSGGYTNMRLTSRLYGGLFTTPVEVLQISERIRQFCGVSQYPLIHGHGRDGVVVSYTKPGGDVYRHCDPKSTDGTSTLRCNVMTQDADAGGDLYIGGEKTDVSVGDLHCYLVSEHEHWVEPVQGNTPRIMWMFGAHVPAEDWDSGKIIIGEQNERT